MEDDSKASSIQNLESESTDLAENVQADVSKGVENEVDKERKEAALTEKKVQLSLQDYVIPGIIYLLSILAVFFVIMPATSTVFSNIQETQSLRSEYEALVRTREEINNLSGVTNTQQEVITVVDRIIPQSQTAVVDFNEQIRELAEANGLELSGNTVRETVTISEVDLGNDSIQSTTRLELVELPAEFSIKGDFADLKVFLVDLYSGDDFIIIKNMELQKVLPEGEDSTFSLVETNIWSMNVVLTKYQFRLSGNRDETELQSSYFSVPASSRPNSEVVEFILENYTANTTTTTTTNE